MSKIAFYGIDSRFSFVGNYDEYKIATVNGVVRLHEDTPQNIKGLGTFGLKTCFCIILMNPKKKISLTHFTPKKTDFVP
jgi:hypothetical protein